MICDHVAIIVGGRILSQGRLSDLVSEKVLFTEITVSGLLPAEAAPFGESVSAEGGRLLLKVHDQDKIEALLALIRDRRARIHSSSHGRKPWKTSSSKW